MHIRNVSCVYFSPTGTTRKIVENIAEGLQAEQINWIDFTKRSQRNENTFGDEVVIIGAPVYYGRLPQEVTSCLSLFKGRKTPVIVVVVYGNRDYEDALKEMYDISVKQGFIPVAGGAFIGEHSYSSSIYPIAQGRPDTDDVTKAREFGRIVRDKILSEESLEKLFLNNVPGNFPYVEHKSLLQLKEDRKTDQYTPETDVYTCILCGKCVEVCPTGAIPEGEPTMTDRWQCILCQACVKNCPTGARQMKNEKHVSNARWLHDMCQIRREPEWYI